MWRTFEMKHSWGFLCQLKYLEHVEKFYFMLPDLLLWFIKFGLHYNILNIQQVLDAYK